MVAAGLTCPVLQVRFLLDPLDTLMIDPVDGLDEPSYSVTLVTGTEQNMTDITTCPDLILKKIGNKLPTQEGVQLKQ